jgi:hypothetical protein
MAELPLLCDELLHLIFVNVDPSDLAHLSATCRRLYSFVWRNNLLWKTQFLQNYDDPRRPGPGARPGDVHFDWEAQLKAMTKLDKILESPARDAKEANRRFVCINAIWLARNASRSSSKNVAFLSHYFRSPKERWDHSDERRYARRTGMSIISGPVPRLKENLNIEVFLRSSLLFNVARGASPSKQDPELLDLSAQLACLYGAEPDLRRARSEDLRDAIGPRLPSHCFARSEVYDLRFYTPENKWGPWRVENGSLAVDWHRVQCLLIVVAYNFRLVEGLRDPSAGNFWTAPFEGVQTDSYDYNERPSRSLYLTDWTPLQEPSPPPELFDPYGVSGSWERFICFLDYPDFARFNFPRYPQYLSGRRPPLDTREAVRGLVIALEVVQVVPPGPKDSKDLPVVHFHGTTRASQDADPNATSRLTGEQLSGGWAVKPLIAAVGTVRMTPNGDVRWSSLSIFNGYVYHGARAITKGVQRASMAVRGRADRRPSFAAWGYWDVVCKVSLPVLVHR